MRYGRQLVEKQRWVQRAVAGARAPLEAVRRIRPSPRQLRYAHRTVWTFSEEGGEVSFGPAGALRDQDAELAHDDPEPPSGCVLPQRAVTRTLEAVWSAFQELRGANPAAYSVYEEKRGLGTFKAAEVLCARVPRHELGRKPGGRRTELLLNLVLAHDTDVESVLEPLATALRAQAPKCLVGVVANVSRAKLAVMGGRREVLLHGRRCVRDGFALRVGGAPRHFALEVGAGSRLLAHAALLPEVARAAVEMSGAGGTDVVWHSSAAEES
ncbi:unnamed protein product [Prorocentrum cordatum]|uniref:Uncharacterized protein n=1 Tax=Prorocentrum cordatum TaxID=2364126 RepID=A0ABN9WIE6_9DINO|nr:unnamed protein product [Polarella glacialis]